MHFKDYRSVTANFTYQPSLSLDLFRKSKSDEVQDVSGITHTESEKS